VCETGALNAMVDNAMGEDDASDVSATGEEEEDKVDADDDEVANGVPPKCAFKMVSFEGLISSVEINMADAERSVGDMIELCIKPDAVSSFLTGTRDDTTDEEEEGAAVNSGREAVS